jgi:integrase/recombinase XerD
MHSPEDREQESRGRVLEGVETLCISFSSYLRGLCKSEGTIKQYLSDIRGWWAWWGKPIEAFDIDAWDSWTSWQAEQGYKGMTIRMHQMGVRRFLGWLKRKKLITENPADLAESVEIADRYPEVLTQEEVKRMAAIPRTARTKALFALLYDCGLRNSEARKLPLAHVHPEYIKVIGKKNRERKVPIVPATKAVLDAWIRIKPESPHLFPTAGGNVVGMEYLCNMVKAWAKSAGINRRITAHTLRHSIATHLIERGMTIEKVQEFMGHKSIETTRIYVHIAQSSLKASVLQSHPFGDAKPQLP